MRLAAKLSGMLYNDAAALKIQAAVDELDNITSYADERTLERIRFELGALEKRVARFREKLHKASKEVA
jgi:hypothetical protein